MPSFSDPLLRAKPPRATPGTFITHEDFTILYKWFQEVNPTSLLYKVWFDVTYYFMMSDFDMSNMLEMRRDSFVMNVDQEKRRYVTLKDQQLFNGLADLADHSSMELRMYEIPGSPQCPVTSLLAYITHIHPAVLYVWQRPREAYRPSEPGIWYDMFRLGLTRLGRMMTQLSRRAGLSVGYRICHVHNTALRHLELAGVCPDLLRELRGTRSGRAERAERGYCRPESEQCDATATCRKIAHAARKRKAIQM